MKNKLVLVLDNIRSVYNVGSIFRTADGVGVFEIFLCGTTPAPVDRFGRDRKDLAKVALGAEKIIPWKYFETTKEAIQNLKEGGFEIVALEQDEKSVNYDKHEIKEKTALILGEETKGPTKEILDLSDVILEIPMRGEKESLNVSVAAGVAMYNLMK